jgi:hypothetical protein
LTVHSQDVDPYTQLALSHEPQIISEGDEILLTLSGQLPNTCFGPPGMPHSVGGSGDFALAFPVTIQLCDICTTPGTVIEWPIGLGTLPAGAYQVIIRFDEESRCLGGSTEYDTAYVYDSFVVLPADGPCPHQGDTDADGVIGVVDVVSVVSTAFRNGPPIQDPTCCTSREDINGDGAVGIQDVVMTVYAAFRGGPPPVDPCSP